MNLLDQQRNQINNQCGLGGIGGGDWAQRDYVQPLLKLPVPTPQKPSMGTKLSKVAEIFELDIIDEVEALKACKTIIEQHTKPRDKTGPKDSVKVIK